MLAARTATVISAVSMSAHVLESGAGEATPPTERLVRGVESSSSMSNFLEGDSRSYLNRWRGEGEKRRQALIFTEVMCCSMFQIRLVNIST